MTVSNKRSKERNITSLGEALNPMNQRKGYREARDYLQLDVSTLETAEDFKGAFRGLKCLMGLLGPVARPYRETCDMMRKALEAQAKLVADIPSQQFYADLESEISGMLEAFEPHLPAEVVTGCRSAFDEFFTKYRKK